MAHISNDGVVPAVQDEALSDYVAEPEGGEYAVRQGRVVDLAHEDAP